MTSVYLKNFLLLAGMVLLSFLVFVVSLTLIIRNTTISEKRESLRSNAEVLTEMYTVFLDVDPNEDPDRMQLFVPILTMSTNQMLVANSSGVIVACSDREINCPHLGQVLSVPFRNMLDSLGEGEEFLELTTMDGLFDTESYVYGSALRSNIDGSHGGYVLVASSAAAVYQEWGGFVSLFVLVALSVLLMAIVIAMVMARHQAQPLREMAGAVNKFARGDFTARVTDRGRMDEIGELSTAFNAMADSLEKSENMRREFIANVSHELKTPMTSITGFAEGILDGTIPAERQTEYLQIVASETKRLSRLVRRMLEVSRLQSMDIREVQKNSFDITELLMRGVAGLETKINEKHLDVELDLPDGPIMVLGEEDSIMQVAYNLLDNAIKFSHPDTAIGISLKQKNGKAYVTVRNTGDPIDRDELPLIFNRFHKSDKSRSSDKDGVGLGLYIVKTIMNTHEEDIYVRSENGVTEFLFTLILAPKKKGKTAGA